MAGKKILIVDDEPNIVDILSVRLAALSYEVITASNGEEAILKTKAEKPDLLILDVLMPKMTGFEALRKIREDRELKDIPAIIISAKGSMKEFFAGKNAVQFLCKPYDPKELVAKIETLIGSSRLRSSNGVVLIGVEDVLLKKIKDCLTLLGYQVSMALNEEDAYKVSWNLMPGLILCQFWEDLTILDPKKIFDKLALHPRLSQVPFYVFCKQGSIVLDAMKSFKEDKIIGYSQTSDLLKALETNFKEKK